MKKTRVIKRIGRLMPISEIIPKVVDDLLVLAQQTQTLLHQMLQGEPGREEEED